MAKGTGSPPPLPALPPPKSSSGKATGERGIFNQFINAHKALKPYAGQIWTWANNYGGITPTELAATLYFESGGNPAAKNPSGALGLAQILDQAASPTNAAGVPFFRPNRQISAQDKLNPAFAIQYMAWRMSGAVQKYGSLQAAYAQNYNPGYTGPGPSALLPKGYVGTPSTTSGQTATRSVGTSAVEKAMKDPWVVQTKTGFKYVNSTQPPNGTITYGGQPITQSEFNQVWKQTYADTFFAYTGRQAKPGEIVTILKNAPSVYTLGNQLANEKSFSNSPVYKKSAPGLVSYARTILGNNWKPSGGIIRRAIAENWDQATFYAHLKTLPAYQQGPEFKTNLAQNQSAFESTYGTVSSSDPSVQALIKQKTLAGWTPDQFKAWLEQQPAYKHTAAWQAKTVSFLSQLGLITGQVPTLSGDQVDQMMNLNLGGQAPPTTGQNANTGATGGGVAGSATAGKRPDIPPRGPLAPNQVSEHGLGGGYR